MKRVFATILFIVAGGVGRLFATNMSMPGETNWWIAGAWLVVGLAALVGAILLLVSAHGDSVIRRQIQDRLDKKQRELNLNSRCSTGNVNK